jgi:hypothetical protein
VAHDTFGANMNLEILVIARHGLGRFVYVYWCALFGHAFTHKPNSSCNLWGSVVCPHSWENPLKDGRTLNHARARTRACTRTLAHTRSHACTRCLDMISTFPLLHVVMCSMFTGNYKRNLRYISEQLITRALARVPAVREHDKYVAHVTCGHLLYVPSKFEENPSNDKCMF